MTKPKHRSGMSESKRGVRMANQLVPPMKMRNKPGRPSAYSNDIAAEIEDKIMKGLSLNSICKAEHLPNITTVHRWLSADLHGFRLVYMRAVQIRRITFAERVSDIALLTMADVTIDPNRARVAMAGLQWAAGRMETASGTSDGSQQAVLVVPAVCETDDELDQLALQESNLLAARKRVENLVVNASVGLSEDVEGKDSSG